MKPSEALFKYKSDKVPFDKYGCHHYGAFYDELFEQFTNPNILEIGVLKGRSLMAWREVYPDAKITAIDIIEYDTASGVKDVHFILNDVKNVKLEENYDVIIDDSSHDLKESTYIVSNFCEHLTEKGVMVIEDIQIPDLYLKELSSVLPKGFMLESHDFRHLTKGDKHDDFIVKITRCLKS